VVVPATGGLLVAGEVEDGDFASGVWVAAQELARNYEGVTVEYADGRPGDVWV
jgi:hypothetical protein